jgi:hypothetical protein
MFAHDPATEGFATEWVEMESACHHEAGHAIVAYALGIGIEHATVFRRITWRDGNQYFGYGGRVDFKRGRYADPNNILRHKYRQAHFREGVLTAAGPAAERRRLLEGQSPQRSLFSSCGDHETIDAIGKALAMKGRCRFAYRRLVWYAALKCISIDQIWEAIEELAEDIADELACAEDEHPDSDFHEGKLETDHIHRICRRHKIKRGMLNKAAASTTTAADNMPAIAAHRPTRAESNRWAAPN